MLVIGLCAVAIVFASFMLGGSGMLVVCLNTKKHFFTFLVCRTIRGANRQ